MKYSNLFKVIIILLTIFAFSPNKNCYAQINYSYDANGNRVKRMICAVCRTLGSSDTAKGDSSAIKFETQHGISVYPNPTNYAINVNAPIPFNTENRLLKARINQKS